jgi:hypothetical protein
MAAESYDLSGRNGNSMRQVCIKALKEVLEAHAKGSRSRRV